MTTERCDRGALAQVYAAEGADTYDEVWSPVIVEGARSVVAALDIHEAQRVLDVGAGTGALTHALHHAAPHATVVSVDRSAGMLGYARERRDAIAVLADAAVLPVPDGSVDAVLLAYVLFHLTEPIAGLREAARVVRIGGTVGTVTWASEEAPVASRVWDETLNRLDVAALPAHGNHSGLDTEDAIAQLFVSAQIQPQRIWRVPVRHRFTAESFWHLRTGTGTNRARLAALAPGRREAVLGDLRARLAELAPDDYEFRGSVIGAVAERFAA